MKINHDIYKLAKDLIKKETDSYNYINTCVRAKICPECGKQNLEYGIEDTLECPCCKWEE